METAVEQVVGPEAFAQIARETGGHYFQIASEETEAATAILFNEMTTPADLVLYEGDLSAGPRNYMVPVDNTAEEANFLLNVTEGSAEVTLKNPAGVTVSPGAPGVTYTAIGNVRYYQVQSPQPGAWQMQVNGSGSFVVAASGKTAIDFEYLSDTSLTKGSPVTLRASLSGPVTNPNFALVRPDGSVVAGVPLFDDGVHNDGPAGDGVYGGQITPSETGNFNLVARGNTPGGGTFGQIATQRIRVHTLNVSAPVGQTVAPGTRVTYQFAISNGGEAAESYNLTASSSNGWVDAAAVSSSITVNGGETKIVTVPLEVPSDTPAAVDELVLVALSQSNLLASDGASVVTRVIGRVFLPVALSNVSGPPRPTRMPTATSIPIGTPSATPTATPTASPSHTATPTVTPKPSASRTPTPTPTTTRPPADAIENADFEDGPDGSWTEFSRQGFTPLILQDFPEGVTPHSGQWAVWLGGVEDEISFIKQQVVVPPDKPYLTYWHWIASADTCGFDFGSVIINSATVADTYDLCTSENSNGWVQHTVNLSAYAGQSVLLQIRAETDESVNSNLFVDDVAFATTGTAVQRAYPAATSREAEMPKPDTANDTNGSGHLLRQRLLSGVRTR